LSQKRPDQQWIELGAQRIAKQIERCWSPRPLVALKQLRNYNWLDVNHGDWRLWLSRVGQLPQRPDTATAMLDQQAVGIQTDKNDPLFQATTEQALTALAPWRKGPFAINDFYLDAEWRSDWKWQRLEHAIEPLQDRMVLDVGTGNGYHLWRMRGAGARFALGIEPSWHFIAQFYAWAHLLDEPDVAISPTTMEAFHPQPQFDTVFSMGVLSHRRDPFTHLGQLKACLRPGGQLVLETLIIEGDGAVVLTPEDRYAGMRNVWLLPTFDLLARWLTRMGFVAIQPVDATYTTTAEQRVTPFSGSRQSLADFLDPKNPRLTREGHQAPLRMVVTAQRPD